MQAYLRVEKGGAQGLQTLYLCPITAMFRTQTAMPIYGIIVADAYTSANSDSEDEADADNEQNAVEEPEAGDCCGPIEE